MPISARTTTFPVLHFIHPRRGRSSVWHTTAVYPDIGEVESSKRVDLERHVAIPVAIILVNRVLWKVRYLAPLVYVVVVAG